MLQSTYVNRRRLTAPADASEPARQRRIVRTHLFQRVARLLFRGHIRLLGFKRLGLTIIAGLALGLGADEAALFNLRRSRTGPGERGKQQYRWQKFHLACTFAMRGFFYVARAGKPRTM